MKEQKTQQAQAESIGQQRKREYLETISEDMPQSELINAIGDSYGKGYKEGFRDGAYWALDLAANQFKGKHFKQEE